MGNLTAFLKQNTITDDNIKYVASNRFIDEKSNKGMEWELCSISSDEDEAIRNSCTKKVPVPGRKNQYIPETDFYKYLGKLASKCIVYPNLDDVELQNSWGVMGSDALVKAMLKPGEYQDLLKKVQEINGFDIGLPNLVEEVKN